MRSDPASLLRTLVAFRTDLGGEERPLANHLADLLRARGADDVTVVDVPRPEGKAAAYVYARYGTPRLLVNAHLDTVPPNSDWSSDPFVPRVAGDRMFGLGTSDTKGAVAAILAALEEARPRDTGILFSGDEESGSRAMAAFVGGPHRAGLERAIVCEPTNLAIGTRHRGFVAFDVTVSGPGGHSSRADTTPAPIAMLAHLAVAYDAWSEAHKGKGPPGFPGMCLNLAKLDGGIAFNVIPAMARLTVSVRPPPGASADAICEELAAIARARLGAPAIRFFRANEAFATRDLASFEPLIGEAVRSPVDLAFWTEAAMLSSAGVDAVVMGTGDIAQAHAPDEWVSQAELERAATLFTRMFRSLS